MVASARVPLINAAALLVAAAVMVPSVGRAAEPAPRVPWDVETDTATASDPAPVRIERRRFRKEGRFVLRAAATYLAREDFYTTPGVTGELSWYPHEWLAIDLVGSAYFASLNATAADLKRRIGLLPDSQEPRGRVMLGGRFAFAYGKFLIETIDTVIHADASLTLHAGGFVTDRTINFAGDVTIAVQVQVGPRFLLWLDAGWLLGYENRSASALMGGPTAAAGIGVLL